MRISVSLALLLLSGVLPPVLGQPGGLHFARRRGSVAVHPDRLRPGARVCLELFAGAVYDASVRGMESSADGRTALYHAALPAGGSAVFAVTGELISGVVRDANGGAFLIRTADGGPVAEEIDERAFPPPHDPLPAAAGEWLQPAAETPREEEPAVIDVMVVYTPAAAAAEGGASRIENLIELAAAEANLSYAESGVMQRIRVVHKALTPYDESAGTFRALLQLTGKADGYMDEVHAWRDLYGADIVSLWTHAADSCGLSWQLTDVNRAFDQFAFSVVNHACAAANLSFAHELGHLMGAQHDRAHALSPGAFPFSYGYRKPGPGGFRTIMSYACADTGSDCPRVPFWSSPDLRYGDSALGEADTETPADNRTTLNQTRAMVAGWRTEPAPISQYPTSSTPAVQP